MESLASRRTDGFRIERTIRKDHLDLAVSYFWDAFGAKLKSVLGPAEKARAFLARAVSPDYAISAVGAGGDLLGVAGFKTPTGAFVGGSFDDLVQVYGLFGGAWRAPLLHLLERDCEEGVLLMDGICVSPTAQGRGIGSALLEATVAEARRRGLGAVRLDVVDSNPRARALYERQRFRPVGTERLGVFRHLFGFASATQMRRQVPQLTP
ncbi:GNAT family N-acetyltransferase [Algihabitans albus]|uniref:GNAT family N-acetyltransferase n=1 Tax=Algihabitans albus TaxID=2164067 RepID=UPI000E5D89E8|nr:GNAT family N-acetyltransferase [Algihabitans albus]